MSTPQFGFGDAKRTTLIPGASPVLITEYMPGAGANGAGAQVINTGLSAGVTNLNGTIYLGSNSSVSPTTGVPLNAGTSLPWTFPGQLWAYLDPASTNQNQDLVVTGDVAGWGGPSPLTLAVATAAQLLAGGIPNVFQSTPLYNGGLAGSSNTGSIPCNQYASIIISGNGSAVASTVILNLTFFDAEGQNTFNEDLIIPAKSVLLPIEFPVKGVSMAVFNNSATAVPNLTVTGTNRPVEKAGQLSGPLGVQVLSNTAVNALGTYNLTHDGTASTPSSFLTYTPSTWIQFAVGNTTCKGQFVAIDTGSVTLVLADTSESGWHTGPSGGSAQIAKEVPLPPLTLAVQFVCQVAAGAAITAQIRYT